MFQNFPKKSKVFLHFWCFCKTNCNFEYRIRIQCIKLYMGTWVKDIFRPEKVEKSTPEIENFPRRVNNFRTKHIVKSIE